MTTNLGIDVADNGDGTASLTTTVLAAVPTSQPAAEPAAVLALAPGYSEDAAAGAISWATSQVESYCERRFVQRTNTVTVTAYDGRALLPDPPVTAVSDVQGWLRWPLHSAASSWQAIDGYGFNEAGEVFDDRLYRGNGVPWPADRRGLKVTYTHGFDAWPQAVIDAVVALAAAYVVNPAGMSERRILDSTYRWMPGVGAAGVVDPFAGLADYVLRDC